MTARKAKARTIAKTNAEVLRCAQDDGEEQATATTGVLRLRAAPFAQDDEILGGDDGSLVGLVFGGFAGGFGVGFGALNFFGGGCGFDFGFGEGVGGGGRGA
jgi:hypothetical protein